MYYNFTRTVKKRIIEALRYCFNANAQYDRLVDQIREKYEWDERPQEGLVLQSASSTPLSLSADNFLGTLHSRVMFAHIEGKEGSFLEWVRENDRLLETSEGFPTAPGVYFIEIEETAPVNGCPQFQFYVDPLIAVQDEPVITFVTGAEPGAFLLNTPLLGKSLRLFTNSGYELLSGKAFTLSAQQSLYIGGSNTHLPLGLPEGQVSVGVTAANAGDYTFTLGVDDELVFSVNGKLATVVFPAGTYTVDQVIPFIRSALDVANIGRSEAPLINDGGSLRIEGSVSLEFSSDLVSTANTVFGFSAGFVAPEITGYLAQPTVPRDATFRVEVDGVEYEVTLTPYPQRALTDILAEIQIGTAASTLTLALEDAGDFALNESTGEITFLHEFEPLTSVVADYKYPEATLGPFDIKDGGVANTDAIPGAVLAFGHSLRGGDAGAIVVTRDFEPVADVYGSKADVSLDIDVIARDHMTRSEIADLVVLYLFQQRREKLAEEGFAIEQVSMGGEAEEPYDESAEDYYYLANISISMKTDWEVYVEKPLLIRRVVPSSFGQEARIASGDPEFQEERPDQLVAVTLDQLSNTVLHTGSEFERIR